MEENEYDSHTPVGKIIKHINLLCKKPSFDNQLNEAIDIFHEQLREQEKYLVNGIFKINFAESALFLQCCAELYGKKIDLLWNGLLELHTRLIKYDYEHQKEKGGPINKEDIQKLEERRNRYLRKKNFKLIQDDTEVPTANSINDSVTEEIVDYSYLIDEDGNYDSDFALNEPEKPDQVDWEDRWLAIDKYEKSMLSVPYFIYKQIKQGYRLKNYPILNHDDFNIIDKEDDEFNTKYSRVPGWHHSVHLVEYNELGLLPDDKTQLIAKLKLTMFGKLQFMLDNRIEDAFEENKDRYAEFCKQFYKKEAKKWQNMPLATLEDLKRQVQFLTALTRKDQRYNKCSFNIHTGRLEWNGEPLEASVDDVILDCNGNRHSIESDLFVRLEKLSNDIINTKLRQDSGIYDFGSVNSNEKDTEGEKEISTDVFSDSGICKGVNDMENNNNVSKENNLTVENVGVNSNHTNCDNSTEDDNFDTRSVMSDHDYCLSSQNENDLDNTNRKTNQTMEEIFKKPLKCERVNSNLLEKNEMSSKRKINQMENDDLPKKRRKLSQKQIQLLLKSKVLPVKLLEFEKFFSENYCPEDGEGVVPTVDYQLDDSNNDDVRSIHSDHSYCQSNPENVVHDSGFFDSSNCGTNIPAEEDAETLPLTNQTETNEAEPPPTKWDITMKEREEMRERVNEWREKITPLLRNLKEHEFDIHKYGSQIIEGMDLNESKPFSRFVDGKSSAEVVRYFISSLQLANTNNIKICGAKPGQLSNDTFELKLVNKDRYHEHLNEYLAPSEATLAEKLKNVQAMNTRQVYPVTPKVKQRSSEELPRCKKSLNQERKLIVNTVKSKFPPSANNQSNNQNSVVPNGTCQQNKENCSTHITTYKSEKGKNILKRQANAPQILNFDISSPSTSGNVNWSNVPCTSSRNICSSKNTEVFDDSSDGNISDVSTNKRKGNDMSEDSFVKSFITVQKMNPDIQVQSTPCRPLAPKRVRVTSDFQQS